MTSFDHGLGTYRVAQEIGYAPSDGLIPRPHLDRKRVRSVKGAAQRVRRGVGGLEAVEFGVAFVTKRSSQRLGNTRLVLWDVIDGREFRPLGGAVSRGYWREIRALRAEL